MNNYEFDSPIMVKQLKEFIFNRLNKQKKLGVKLRYRPTIGLFNLGIFKSWYKSRDIQPFYMPGHYLNYYFVCDYVFPAVNSFVIT